MSQSTTRQPCPQRPAPAAYGPTSSFCVFTVDAIQGSETGKAAR